MRFDQPIASHIAWTLNEVATVLEAVDAAAAAGLWAVGMVSYDAAAAFDPALAAQRHDNVPLAAFGIFRAGTSCDGPAGGSFRTGRWVADTGRDDYEHDVRALKERIAAGDTYQVNYTMRLRATFDGDPVGLFDALCRAQNAEQVCFLDMGDVAVCSASPELFFTRSQNTITSRPMKGTRPRHPDPVKDQHLVDELVGSAKDRAENTMIVDMTRNDLGRIAQIGSLRVPALHSVETYPTVHQMTSTVVAESNATLPEIFAALFPGASITGAPKVNTSRFIAGIESSPRGIYCGAVGVAGPDGFAEFNIAIRTVWIDRIAGVAEYGTGGGIVWDSDPTDEWSEAHHKARVLHRACQQMKLFETIKYEPGVGPTLIGRHLDRLADGADHFGFDFDREQVHTQLEAIELDQPARLRLVVDSNGGSELEVHEMPETPTAAWVLPLDTEPIDVSSEYLYFKTTVRDRYDEARARFAGCPDVILWNEHGEVTETSIGNIVVEVQGEWLTPPVACGLLPGTFRAELIETGIVQERVVTLADLALATRVWMINSLRGWVPVKVRAPQRAFATPSSSSAATTVPGE